MVTRIFSHLVVNSSFCTSEMSDVQHKEWFITALLPHIRGLLMQQKIELHTKALELAMKLEASPIVDDAARMVHIQSQLANLTLQL